MVWRIRRACRRSSRSSLLGTVGNWRRGSGFRNAATYDGWATTSAAAAPPGGARRGGSTTSMSDSELASESESEISITSSSRPRFSPGFAPPRISRPQRLHRAIFIQGHGAQPPQKIYASAAPARWRTLPRVRQEAARPRRLRLAVEVVEVVVGKPTDRGAICAKDKGSRAKGRQQRVLTLVERRADGVGGKAGEACGRANIRRPKPLSAAIGHKPIGAPSLGVAWLVQLLSKVGALLRRSNVCADTAPIVRRVSHGA